ncbi:MAG: hypothetical protein AB1757_14530 [Acidobacteriota bacterium]
MLTLEEAEVLTGENLLKLRQLMACGQLHFNENPDGCLWICLISLLSPSRQAE